MNQKNKQQIYKNAFTRKAPCRSLLSFRSDTSNSINKSDIIEIRWRFECLSIGFSTL